MAHAARLGTVRVGEKNKFTRDEESGVSALRQIIVAELESLTVVLWESDCEL